MNKIKTFLIDTQEETEKLSRELSKLEGIDVIGREDDGIVALEKILKSEVDVVVLECVIKSIDGFEIINKIKEAKRDIKFVMLSSLSDPATVGKAVNVGANYFMLKPTMADVLAKRIEEVYKEKGIGEPTPTRLDEKITNIFITVGIPAHIKGYYFLRDAIKMAVDDPHIINSITKRLYPSIAEMYQTSASKVERAIRHAIEVAWNKGKIENINDVFGLRVYDTNEKPTNGEFIALVADKMLLGQPRHA